jgi:hypothetical protein
VDNAAQDSATTVLDDQVSALHLLIIVALHAAFLYHKGGWSTRAADNQQVAGQLHRLISLS